MTDTSPSLSPQNKPIDLALHDWNEIDGDLRGSASWEKGTPMSPLSICSGQGGGYISDLWKPSIMPHAHKRALRVRSFKAASLRGAHCNSNRKSHIHNRHLDVDVHMLYLAWWWRIPAAPWRPSTRWGCWECRRRRFHTFDTFPSDVGWVTAGFSCSTKCSSLRCGDRRDAGI